MDRIFYQLECALKDCYPLTRGRFLKLCFSGIIGLIAQNAFLKKVFAKETPSTGRPKKNIKGNYDLVVAEGPNSYKNTEEAVKKMGGMNRFVKKGDVVVVKPNIGWDRNPSQAANTDPQVVAALVALCYEAGAKRVNVFDITCSSEKACYKNSGIAEAAKAKGAQVFYADTWNVVNAKFSYKSLMEGWPILRDAVACDTLINVPVLKHHSLAELTIAMKNLMGVCGSQRGMMHIDIGEKVADLNDFLSPELTIIDATRVLLRNGPSGGRLSDVLAMNQVIAATDATLADSYAATLMKKDPLSIPSIKAAAARKFGSADIQKAKILKFNV